MASGKKGYFRHFMNARHDPKVVALMDEHGKEAYFHYFALLEMCAAVASEEFPANGEFVFMRSTVCRELMVTQSRLTRHLVAIQSAQLGHIVVTEKTVTCSFPNFRKYMGKYETKSDPNSPNKRKEKERKEKEREAGILQMPKAQEPGPSTDPETVGDAIWQAIGDHGASSKPKYRAAEKQIGPLAWTVVERLGGWHRVCQTTEFERVTFISKCKKMARELAKEGA